MSNAIKYNRRGGQVNLSRAPPGGRRCARLGTGRARHRPRLERRAAGAPVRALQPAGRRTRRHRRPRHRPDDGAPPGAADGRAAAVAEPRRAKAASSASGCRCAAGAAAPVPAPATQCETAAPRGRSCRCCTSRTTRSTCWWCAKLLALRPGFTLHVAARRPRRHRAALQHAARPGAGGHAAARHGRPRTAAPAARAALSARLIALSANAMPDAVAQARESGFDDYWTKPIDVAQFLAGLDRLASTRPNATRSTPHQRQGLTPWTTAFA